MLLQNFQGPSLPKLQWRKSLLEILWCRSGPKPGAKPSFEIGLQNLPGPIFSKRSSTGVRCEDRERQPLSEPDDKLRLKTACAKLAMYFSFIWQCTDTAGEDQQEKPKSFAKRYWLPGWLLEAFGWKMPSVQSEFRHLLPLLKKQKPETSTPRP